MVTDSIFACSCVCPENCRENAGQFVKGMFGTKKEIRPSKVWLKSSNLLFYLLSSCWLVLFFIVVTPVLYSLACVVFIVEFV